VNLVAGPGTFFFNRDRIFPDRLRGRWSATLPRAIFTEMALRFDGTNEAEVQDWLRSNYCISVTPQARNFFAGIMSEAERATIAAGLHDVVMDHLVDVADHGDRTELVFRSGATRSIPPDSWIVNCTGYLLRTERPYEPYLSEGGAVMSVQSRSMTMQLSSVQAYFLTHLLFLEQLREAPLYELDAHDLRNKAPDAFPGAMATLSQYNASITFDAAPRSVFTDCGVDYDLWFPLPRRMAGAVRFMRSHRRAREHYRRSLDRIRERFDTRCGPLDRH
jgi:hypothetical protein